MAKSREQKEDELKKLSKNSGFQTLIAVQEFRIKEHQKTTNTNTSEN